MSALVWYAKCLTGEGGVEVSDMRKARQCLPSHGSWNQTTGQESGYARAPLPVGTFATLQRRV